jgi:hypothetical protein
MPGIWSYVVLVCVGGLSALLTVWGGSLLYRALDGDRFTTKGRVRGRWVNRISKPILFLACLSIVLGGVATFIVLTILSGPFGRVLWHIATTAIISLAVIVLAWSWAGRRSAGKPRCPQCSYDVSTIPSMTCPECGFVAETANMWHKPRKRKRGLVAGTFLGLVAIGFIAMPYTIGYGWRKLIPTSVLVSTVTILPDTVFGVDDNLYWGGFTEGSLLARLDNGQLSNSQIDDLIQKAENGIVESRNTKDLIRWVALAQFLPKQLHPQFTPSTAAALIENALVPEPTQTSDYWDDFVNTVDWTGLQVLDEKRAEKWARELPALGSSETPSILYSIRFSVALALNHDTEFLTDSITRILDEQHGLELRLNDVATLLSSLPEKQKRVIISLLWKNWLESKGSGRRYAILQLLQYNPRTLDAVSPELKSLIVTELLEIQASELPERDQVLMMHESWWGYSKVGQMLDSLLSDEANNAVILAAEQDRLSLSDIAVIARFRRAGPTPPFPIPLLIGLTEHEDPLVRAAAALAIEHAIADHREAIRPYDTQLMELESNPINEEFQSTLEQQLDLEAPSP